MRIRRLAEADAVAELAGPTDTRLPTGFAVRLADNVRRSRTGRLLLGGSPPRLLRLSAPAARLLTEGWLTVSDDQSGRLARRLLDAGAANPRPPGQTVRDATIVIPVRDRAGSLHRLLTRLRQDPDTAELPVIVVDDGSTDPAELAVVTGRHRAELVTHQRNLGPAAARNTGLRRAHTELVAFCDSDTVPEPGWLGPLTDQFADPAVALAAPRITPADPATAISAVISAAIVSGWLAKYEHTRSPLDMGARESAVVPLSALAYVPSAAIVVRRSAMGAGFAPHMRVAEDVDLCLRLHRAGWRLRYVPSARVGHQHRTEPLSWLRQRIGYGSGAAELAVRHPGQMPPLYAAPWSLAACALVLRGRPWSVVLGAAITAVAAARLIRRMPDADTPVRASVLLALAALRGTAGQLTQCATRHHWPLALVAAATSRRARRIIVAMAVLDGLVDHRRSGSTQNPLAHLLARRLDDLGYGAGVWVGALRGRTAAPLIPRLALRKPVNQPEDKPEDRSLHGPALRPGQPDHRRAAAGGGRDRQHAGSAR